MTVLRFGALAVLILATTGTPAALATDATSMPAATPVTEPAGLAYPPDAEIHGASLGAWHGRYWQWVTSFPVGENPAQDPTGVRCGYGQHDPLIFIPSNLPPCTVPAGVAIFLPIAGTACSTLEPPPRGGGSSVAELRACAAADAERSTNIQVTVDGAAVPDIETYRAPSPVFSLQLPADNVLAVPAGSGRAVADGYAVVLAPLPSGEHEIVVHVEVTDGYALPDKTLILRVMEAGADA